MTEERHIGDTYEYLGIEYTFVNTLADIDLSSNVFCFDFETICAGDLYEAYEWYREEVEATILIVTTDFDKNYIMMLHKKYGSYNTLKRGDFIILKNIIENPDIAKVAHNIKFDLHIMEKYTGRLDLDYTSLYDTQVIGHLIDPHQKTSLKDWIRSRFSELGDYEKGIDYRGPLMPLAAYGSVDGSATFELWTDLMHELQAIPELERLHKKYCQPALLSLFEAERNGAFIAKDILQRWIHKGARYIEKKIEALGEHPKIKRYIHETNAEKQKVLISQITEKRKKHKETSKQYEKYTVQINDLRRGKKVYTEVNFASNQQISDILYTDKGFGFKGRGTDYKQLKKFSNPFINDLLDHRAISKLTSTYYKGIKYGLCKDKLHPSFKLCGTSTGRLSCSNPNLQNIPKHIKREDVKQYTYAVREFFVAPEGYSILQADFSQAELRMAANFSDDEVMIQAYLDGVDIHALTGAGLAGMPLEDFLVSDKFGEYRRIGKTANFGLIYGMQPKAYREYVKDTAGLKISRQKSEEMVETFFDTYPKLRLWHKNSIFIARQRGFAETVFGRRLPLPDLRSHEFWKSAQAERVAINMPVQGTVGELTVWAGALCGMVVDRTTKYFLNVHDSIMFYVKDELINQEAAKIKHISENLPVEKYFGKSLGPVPMVMDIEVGKTWKTIKELTID